MHPRRTGGAGTVQGSAVRALALAPIARHPDRVWFALLLACAPAPAPAAPDADGDGVADADDCAPGDPSVFPGQIDACDGLDQDCDFLVDEDAPTAAWYLDLDRDGYGDPAEAVLECRAPDGYVGDHTDCAPADATAFPGATEWCDGFDHDCDGQVGEEDAVDPTEWHADADADGFGAVDVGRVACEAGPAEVGNGLDCDDTRGDVNPGAPEVCDDADVDEDCDGVVEDADGAAGGSPWYGDGDGDGHGEGTPVWFCEDPGAGWSVRGADCDDADPAVSPDAVEVCGDGVDADCDGADCLGEPE